MIKIIIFCLSFNLGVRPEISDNTLVEEIYSLVNSFFVSKNGTNYIEKIPSTLYKINEIEELKSYLSEWNADTIFDDEDIDYMCEQYYQHKNFRWEESRLNGNVKVIHRTFFSKKIKLLFCKFREEKVKKAIYFFSVPLFNKDRDKAIVYYSFFTWFGDGYGEMMVFRKKDSKWIHDHSSILGGWIS